MKRKVKIAIFDVDLKASVKKYPVSDSGDRIKVVKGGESHFMPKFNHTSFIEFPRPWWKGGGYERIYFARKGAGECVDFQTGAVAGPDPELIKEAAGATMLKDLGKEEPPFPTWMIYLILLCSIGILLKVFGVIV